MQEYWELYMKQVDSKPAVVMFNAGISMELEEVKTTYPTIAFVKVVLQEPDDKGLLGTDEELEINFLEDKLEASLIKFRIGKYVGKIISGGEVTFLYYLQFTYNWQDFLEYALKEFGHYEISSGYQEDSEWNYYQKLLYPTPKEWQIIQNHKACDHLRANGDNLHLPRAIEHKLFFDPSGNNREAVIARIEKEGFSVQKEIENEEGKINVLPMVEAMLQEADVPAAVSKFFHTLVEIIAAVHSTYDLPLVLSGGVFQNRVLVSLVLQKIPGAIISTAIPPNDGGIALGQVASLLE
jgi:hypothetical protein